MSDDGKWAIITGASSGIGRALAMEFAAAGFNVLITGRDNDALKQLARQCEADFHVQTDCVPADLDDSNSVGQLIEAIAGRPRRYEVLANNAGFSVHGDFATSDVQSEIDLINVQLTAALRLIKAVLPGMIERAIRAIDGVSDVSIELVWEPFWKPEFMSTEARLQLGLM